MKYICSNTASSLVVVGFDPIEQCAVVDFPITIEDLMASKPELSPTEKVVNNAVAVAIVEGLSGELRDRVMAQAIAEFLKSSEIQTTANKLLSERAQKIAAELVEEGMFDAKIREALAIGFTKAVQAMEKVGTAAFIRAMCGTNNGGIYGNDKQPSPMLEELIKALK